MCKQYKTYCAFIDLEDHHFNCNFCHLFLSRRCTPDFRMKYGWEGCVNNGEDNATEV